MTECERIINEKILPKEFFKEEYMDGFFVDEKRKKVWAVELDLLIKFDQVCKKHNLRYYIMFGSLLGVIRHKGGFIPWDDDLDVCMPRQDYEKLMKLGAEFEEPYFLQTPYSDEGFCCTSIKLRNSNTSGINHAFRYEKFNLGIWLDIGPLDKCEIEGLEERFEEIKELNLQCSGAMRLSNPNPDEKDKNRIALYKGDSPVALYEKVQKIASQFEEKNTEYISYAVCTMVDPRTLLFKAEDFEDVEYVQIQGYSFPIPKNYDSILRVRYGDYMKFPPVSERGTEHGVFEPDIPYKEFLRENLPY